MKGKPQNSKVAKLASANLVSANLVSANADVRLEIDDFLQALESYPLGFAAEPGISFDQHRAKLRELTRAGPLREGKLARN